MSLKVILENKQGIGWHILLLIRFKMTLIVQLGESMMEKYQPHRSFLKQNSNKDDNPNSFQ